MQLKKIVGIFYLIYTVYILLICWMTDVTVIYILPALFAMWLVYGCFAGGGRIAGKVNWSGNALSMPRGIRLKKSEQGFLWTLGILCSLVCGMIVIRFYTGMSPGTVIKNLFTGVSNYYTYAYYFAEHVEVLPSTARLPYSILVAVTKAIFVFGVVYWGLLQKMSVGSLTMALLCCSGHFYISLGRGTNFELYEFVILVVYIILKRTQFELSLKQFSARIMKPLILCLIVGICLVTVYYIVLDARGYVPNNKMTEDIWVDESTFLPRYLPGLALLIFNLFGYLGFGLFYIASYFQKVLMASPSYFVAALFPGGYQLLAGESTKEIMSREIDVGVMWHTDLINGINAFGIVGVFLLVVALGFVCGKIEAAEEGQWSHMAGYMLMLQMLSFPVGNFIMCSRANQMLVIALVLVAAVKPVARPREGQALKSNNQSGQ